MTWIVHVGGLVRTGAGAVKDALLDSGHFLSLKGKTFAMSESRVFVGRPAIPDFVARTEGLTGLDVLGLWTNGTRLPEGAVIGGATRRFLARTRVSHANNRKFLLKVADEPLRAAAEETAAGIARAAGGDARSDAYIAGTRHAMRTLLPLDGRMIVVDNDPAVSPAIRRHLRLDPHSIFIGVIRDLSDQYADRRTGVDPDQSRPRNLAHMTASALLRRSSFEELAAAVDEFPDRCLIVEFDRFVSDDAYRERFLHAVLAGAPPRARERPARFAPERSARNVGLAMPKRDALQHAVYTRLLGGPYRAAQVRSGPDVWPEVATVPDVA